MSESGQSGALGALIRRRPLTVLIAAVLLAWLPGFFTVPPLDRDEPRFAQASKQMLETGDFININLGDEARSQKPIGIYWLQAASTAVLSQFLPEDRALTSIWTYRVPSFLGALAALLLTFQIVRLFAPVETAFYSALLLGSTLLLMVESKNAKTDAVLLATILGTQYFLLRLYLNAREPQSAPAPGLPAILCGWACFALGILVKGPIIALVCGFTAIAVSLWDRQWRWLARSRPILGTLLTLLIVLPWMIAIGIATNGEFFLRSLGQDFAFKVAGVAEAHGAPPGYFTLFSNVTFWPATLVLIPAIWFGFRHRNQPVVRYLLAWAGSVWLMFELTPTKLPHYVLPAYPALAILGAMWLTRSREGAPTRGERIAVVASLAIFLVVTLALAGLLLAAPFALGPGASLLSYYGVGAGVITAFVVAAAVKQGKLAQAVGAAVLCAVVLYGTTWIGVAPALTEFRLSPQIAAAVARHARPDDPPVVIAGYAEPSAIFLLGTDTVLTVGAAAGEIAARKGGLAVIEAGDRPAFLEAISQGSALAMPLEEIRGINYSNGSRLTLGVYRVSAPPG